MKKALIVASVASMIGQFNMNNISILQDLDYEVQVTCNFKDRSVWTEERVAQFMAELRNKKIIYYHIDFPRKPSAINKICKAYNQLKQIIHKEKYDLIHCHTPVAGILSRIIAHKYEVKVIYTAHGFHFYNGAPKLNWIIYYPIEKFFSRWTDVLITINLEDYRRAKKKFHAKKTVYVPGIGINLDEFKKNELNYLQNETSVLKNKLKIRQTLGCQSDEIMFISVGELSARKNHQIVIRALYQVKQELKVKFKYFIVGKGALQDKLENLIERLGLCENIQLLGFRTDVGNLLNAADVFVFPSLQEGLPVALMEAMASGLICVASKIRGNIDLIKDNNYLFNPMDQQSLYNILRRLMMQTNLSDEHLDFFETLRIIDVNNVNQMMQQIYLNVEKTS